MTAKDRQFANTLARGLEILRCFRVGEPLLGNKEIAQRTGFPKATVSRLTHTLIELGYLRRNGELGKYELASAVLSIGYPLLGNMRIRQVARPFMKELADQVNGSVSAGLRDRINMVYVETCRANEALPRRPDIGSSLPIVQSAMGRAWLAAATENEREHALREIRHDTPDAWRTYRARWSRATATSARGVFAFPTAIGRRVRGPSRCRCAGGQERRRWRSTARRRRSS